MKYSIEITSRFKRDYKKVKKRGCNIELLKNIVIALANGEKLPPENRDHELKGEHKGYRECHIQPDWLLVYKIEEDILILTLSQTGTHSDLFK